MYPLHWPKRTLRLYECLHSCHHHIRKTLIAFGLCDELFWTSPGLTLQYSASHRQVSVFSSFTGCWIRLCSLTKREKTSLSKPPAVRRRLRRRSTVWVKADSNVAVTTSKRQRDVTRETDLTFSFASTAMTRVVRHVTVSSPSTFLAPPDGSSNTCEWRKLAIRLINYLLTSAHKWPK